MIKIIQTKSNLPKKSITNKPKIKNKKVKLTKEEKKAAKIAARKEYEAHRAEMLKKREEERKLRKAGQLPVDERPKPKPEKFVPRK